MSWWFPLRDLNQTKTSQKTPSRQKQNKNPETKNIIYIDTHFDHPDRTSREGEVNKINQEIF